MLTPEQAHFVFSPPQNAFLVACPGSGKTYTGVQRFIERASAVNGIAYLSFTRVAVKEARDETHRRHARHLLTSPNFLGTIDAFVRQYIFDPFVSALLPGVPAPNIIVELSYLPQWLDVQQRWIFDPDSRRYYKPWAIKLTVGDDNRPKFVTDGNADLPDAVARRVLAEKERYLRDGFATHNDILLWGLKALASADLNVASVVSSRFKEIIVDEAQDTSRIQQRVLARLQASGAIVTYIGDPLQSIYTFNDADPTFLDAHDTERFALTLNLRSSSQITTLINNLYGTDMRSAFSTLSAHKGISVLEGDPQQCVEQFRHQVEAANIDYSDAAVVVRSQELRSELRGALNPDIPYSVALKRLLRAIGALQAGEAQESAKTALDFLQTVIDVRIETDDERVDWTRRAWIFLREYLPQPGDESVDEWLAALREALNRFAQRFATGVAANAGRRLQRRDIPEEITARDMLGANRGGIRVETVHGVKGESIRAVLVVGTAAHHRAWLQGRNSEIGRLGYVALSRARTLLAIGCPTPQIAAQWRGKITLWQMYRADAPAENP